MRKNDITSALKERLSDAAILSAAWPNVHFTGALPYLDVSFATSRRESDTLTGEAVCEIGRMSVVVVVGEGTGVESSEDYAEAVFNLFPMGFRLILDSATITITGPADIREGFMVDDEYRTPVIIKYQADEQLNNTPLDELVVFEDDVFEVGVFV